MLFGISPWPRLSSLGVGITHTSAPTMAILFHGEPESATGMMSRMLSLPNSEMLGRPMMRRLML
ncbi:hypothetical protein D3C81_2222820 [compost metagenome]